MPLTEHELEKLEALAKAATPGPWDSEWVRNQSLNQYGVVRARGLNIGTVHHHPNLEFISESRQAVPELVSEVRRLTAELNEALGEVGWLKQALRPKYVPEEPVDQACKDTVQEDAWDGTLVEEQLVSGYWVRDEIGYIGESRWHTFSLSELAMAGVRPRFGRLTREDAQKVVDILNQDPPQYKGQVLFTYSLEER